MTATTLTSLDIAAGMVLVSAVTALFVGYLVFAPDHEAVVWSQAERAKGQAWGMQTVAAFHIKGTPPVPAEEELLAGH